MKAFHIACIVLAVFFFFGGLRRTMLFVKWASQPAYQVLYKRPTGASVRWIAFILCVIGAFA